MAKLSITLPRDPKAIQDKIDILCLQGQTFRHETTSQTAKIITDSRTYMYSDSGSMPFSVLSLSGGLKKMILKNEAHIENENYSNQFDTVQYFEFCNSIKRMESYYNQSLVYYDCLEIDISKAYYNAALLLGLIDKPFYTKCLGLEKLHRLKLIGSIATVKYVTYYEAGKYLKIEIKKNDTLRKAWFLICNYVDSAMQFLRTELKESFLFYWVDGIYLERISNFDLLIFKTKQKYGFDFEVEEIPQIEVENLDGRLKVYAYKSNGSKKEFTPKSERQKPSEFTTFSRKLNKKG